MSHPTLSVANQLPGVGHSAPIAPLPRGGHDPHFMPDKHGVIRPICSECKRKTVEVRDGVEQTTCFRCRVASVGFGWHGGGFLYGRDNFSSRTNAEYIAEHVGDTAGKAHIGSLDWKDV